MVVARKGREKTYDKYFRYRDAKKGRFDRPRGCIDGVLVVDEFKDVLKKNVQEKIRKENALFIHSRYFWVYFPDYEEVEKNFRVPMFGSRSLLKLEERDQPFNQYHLLAKAGIRTPKIFGKPEDIDRPVIVKAREAARGYERGFFVVSTPEEYEEKGSKLEHEGKIADDWRSAVIEEFIVGAPVNFNFFYSPLSKELELIGTDTRRQTNLDGVLRMPAWDQMDMRDHLDLKMIETGHMAVTVKESLLERAFNLGEKFVTACKKLPKLIDPDQKGIIGPFALQGAVVAEEGKEDIVIFDVSFRIPGSPAVRATPYSGYLYGESVSMGERIGMEIRRAVEEKRLEEVLT
jgi:5-formaminoimidazole-4-carboxamide-1-(beta)-D-ribofuranosyl 5'-monophosphate synthetase